MKYAYLWAYTFFVLDLFMWLGSGSAWYALFTLLVLTALMLEWHRPEWFQ
jgi:hypothetical protein